MAVRSDELLSAIEAAHSAGLDEELWPQALGAAARLLGANCATLETLAAPSLQHLGFLGFNIPPASELLYLREYVPLSPRTRFATSRRAGDLLWDHKLLNEAEMDRHPFYQEFLRQVDLRYFYGGVLEHNGREMTAVTFHRARKLGHVNRREIAVMQRLLPHLRQAYDMTTRLRKARGRAGALESALDWLVDGVALLDADGRIVHANDAFQEIARRRDGVRTVRGAIETDAPAPRERLAAAIAAVNRFASGDTDAHSGVDFPVPRSTGEPPYIFSLRPLVGPRSNRHAAVAILFVHDPLRAHAAALLIARESFGLTAAEADLALALQGGATVADYARSRRLSVNTVYTHLRRLKDKTGAKRLSDLMRRLADLRLPLRAD